MVRFYNRSAAFGAPGIEPRWTQASKDGIGTAYYSASRVWFTIWNGAITEVYYPTVDRPQIRDLQYLISDGQSFFHEEKRHLDSRVERMWPHGLGYRIHNRDPLDRYTVIKEVISDPRFSCVLQRTRLTGDPSIVSKLQLYALCAPHLNVGGWGNHASVTEVAGQFILTARKGKTWLALGATIPFARLSCGYVGKSDGWTDLADNFRMDWQFDRAPNGNIALTGQLDLESDRLYRSGNSIEFTLGLAFGDSVHNAISTLFQSLELSFDRQEETYKQQWDGICQSILPLDEQSGDGGNLYHSSFSLLLAHEDKSYPGAMIASLSIPWGEAMGDLNQGGYHLVWTRDMVNSATALLAAGDRQTPTRALVYLATNQGEDGGFAQNFWIDGDPYWTGIQLDEVAFPILLAWKLQKLNALVNFDIYPMVLRAAGFLVRQGPVTQQERWEEAGGFSPSTLAACIAALICASAFARARKDGETARFLEEYADFLESHLETWTVTNEGTLVPGIRRHYIRINPASIDDPRPDENPDRKTLAIANHPPDERKEFPAKEIVDAGFLQLVRFGIRKPDDPIVLDSIKVIDAVIKVDTFSGPCWHRYNHDGYGQREDGGPFVGWGKGRAWPLLTGERGHYELAAGHDPKPYIQAMERFASSTGLLPEQVWDEADRPEIHMFSGHATGSAMPLMWAHAEYINLLRSTRDGKGFDFIPEVADRYLGDRHDCKSLEIWKFNRQIDRVNRGQLFRIQAQAPFRLHWSRDNWQNVQDTDSIATVLDIHYVDLAVAGDWQGAIDFTFFWTHSQKWENRDFRVAID
ncbi:glycoside hydrolase family 15 protein [Pannus brasiliensis CCIBt3594]|uniref:Glycoside hydrolase family 15 protein n=1 Tax=Pannus brasiliensis CCIBt3594 TaxID=1427578 RepID=A0AAW9QV61_9CHRO